MIQVGDTSLQPAEVVGWLRDNLSSPANPAETTPAQRLTPALKAAPEAERDEALLALADALSDTDDNTLRLHLIYALQGFDTEALRDRLVDMLEPAPATWLSASSPGGGTLAADFFRMLGHGPGTKDDRLVVGLRYLAKSHGLMEQALPHFVSFHPQDHGFDLLMDHLKAGNTLDAGLAGRFGGRFARDAKDRLPKVADALKGHPREAREAFWDNAEWRLDDVAKQDLKARLGL